MKNRLKELRQKAGKTQSEVAAFLGVSSVALSYYESGKRDIDNESLCRLADYYSVTTDELLGRGKRRTCVFAGTFDPFTRGHENTVNEALAFFDEVVIAILINKNKKPMFTMEERIGFIQKLFCKDARVKVISYEGLAVDLLKELNTTFYVRGLRNDTDFDYENSDYYASKRIFPELITIYLPCKQEYLHISSSIVKNALLFGKDIGDYVPALIREDIVNTFKEKQRN